MKKRLNILLILLTILLLGLYIKSSVINVNAESINSKITIYDFTKKGCSNCKNSKLFLTEFEANNDSIEVLFLDIDDYSKLYKDVKMMFDIETSPSMPVIVIGGWFNTGFNDSIGKNIEKVVNYYNKNSDDDKYLDLIKFHTDNIEEGFTIEINEDMVNQNKLQDTSIDVPILGLVDYKEVSCLVVSIVFGLLDGFNPCGMWILIFIISLLIPTNDKKKIWILGGTFIITSGLFYFLLLMSWSGFTELIPTNILKIATGIIAILVGCYNLYKYIKARIKKEDGCDVTSAEQKRKLSFKVRSIINDSRNIVIAIIGIAGITLLVNLIEVACSTGWPMIFSNILSVQEIPFGGRLLYILIYVIFFLLDDLIVFSIAVITMRIKVISNKLTKYSHLICAIIMLAFGILMLFFPNILGM